MTKNETADSVRLLPLSDNSITGSSIRTVECGYLYRLLATEQNGTLRLYIPRIHRPG